MVENIFYENAFCSVHCPVSLEYYNFAVTQLSGTLCVAGHVYVAYS